MTKMKLAEISSRVYATSTQEDVTHMLLFRQESAPSHSMMGGPSTLSLYMTAAEAAQYTLGQEYDVSTTPLT